VDTIVLLPAGRPGLRGCFEDQAVMADRFQIRPTARSASGSGKSS